MLTFVRLLPAVGKRILSNNHVRLNTSVVTKLSPFDVDNILIANEYTHEFGEGGPVKYYESNQLASNSPIEDSKSEAMCLATSGLIFGVFDGHGGPACGQVVAKRLIRYLAANLTPKKSLQHHLESGGDSDSIIANFNERQKFVDEVRELYERSFIKYATELVTQDEASNKNMKKIFENSFLRLDRDISDEAINCPSPRTLSVALSGTCAVVAHVDSAANVSVASCGDCVAVLGSLSETGLWMAKKFTQEHNSDNVKEIRRILSEHPTSEKDTVIKSERLLGQLAPLRAMGDFKFKWPKEQLNKFELTSSPFYLTPPYLSCLPEVAQQALTPKDRFLVLASDGLWDMISPVQAVRLIGEHMSGKAFLQPLKLPKRQIQLEEIEQMLDRRKEGLLKKPHDRNAATHLLRYAIGASDLGNIEHQKLSHMLSLPKKIVRLFRDDITITIIYFDPNFLRTLPT